MRGSSRRTSWILGGDESLEGCDFVFHLAANADMKDNLLEPRKCIEQNIVATQNLLEAMRGARLREVAFASTGAVYGEPAVVPTPEDAPFPVQTSIYGTSKLAAEGLLTSSRSATGSGPGSSASSRCSGLATRTGTSSISGAG